MRIRVKRIYEDAADDDGYRALVDGMWPRGVAKRDARLDAWPKSLAPSKELRRWFGHDRERWEGFHDAYWRELDAADQDIQEILDDLQSHAGDEGLTLIFAAKDTECNNAVVLKRYLERAE
ncbi:DUF488 domain-containing protein [Salinisphaera sp.]|uniref:DUF488 domain-containing protein n=1 Tax=Salinisphaera sp. TaxID=1914330 RepID=UPI002D774768|nr:DUF488 family protein [Salinisphaera sp.]HET7314616.1 DUF488 family protein [Salinisphaera sp.]